MDGEQDRVGTEPVADGVDDFVTGKVVAVRSSPRSGWSAFPRVMRRSRWRVGLW